MAEDSVRHKSWEQVLAGPITRADVADRAAKSGVFGAHFVHELVIAGDAAVSDHDALQRLVNLQSRRLEERNQRIDRYEEQLIASERLAEQRLTLIASMRRQMGELHAEAQRLRQELDARTSANVLIYPGDNLDDAALVCMDEPDGTVIRSATSGKEIVKSGGTWHVRNEGDDHG